MDKIEQIYLDLILEAQYDNYKWQRYGIYKNMEIYYSIKHVKDRINHDVLYHVNDCKIRALGWKPIHNIKNEINSYTGHRTVHQSVPRHLRRRQASHFPHRLPKRFVLAALAQQRRNEASKQGKTDAQLMQKKKQMDLTFLRLEQMHKMKF